MREPQTVHVSVDAIHIHFHADSTAAADPRIAEILSTVRALSKGATAMASDLSDLTEAVAANGTVQQSAITLLDGLKSQLDAALASNDTAALRELSTQLSSQRQALADALVRNTPAESGGGATDPNAPRPDQSLPGAQPLPNQDLPQAQQNRR